MSDTTVSSGLYIPDIIANELVKGFAGAALLRGSGAAVMIPGLRVGSNGVGTSVNVPYVANVGEWDSLAETDPTNAAQMTSDKETETVGRYGKAVLITRSSQGAALALNKNKTLDQIAADQLKAGALRKIDALLVARAVRNTSTEWDAFTNDISGASGAAANLTPDAAVNTVAKLGDEGFNPDEFACALMHSAVMAWLLKLKDTVGRNLLFGSLSDGVANGRYTLMGVPILVSDRAPVSGGVYQTVFAKKNSLACYYDETAVTVEITRKAEYDAWRLDANLYAAVHRYVHVDGMDKPGIAVLKHKIGS